MRRLAGWIKGHQVVAFFIITFAISHAIGIAGVFLFSGDHAAARTAQFVIVRLLLFGPALAGMIVARAAASKERDGSRQRFWAAFAVGWVLACVISVLYMWRTAQGSPALSGILRTSALGAIFPAIIISGAYSRIGSIRDYISTLLRPRGNPVWYLVALFTFPIIHILGNAITSLLGGTGSRAAGGFTPDLLGLAAITFFHVLFYTGGINEESGWRGFALPRLQGRFCPLVACLVIWFFHVLWELPFDTVFSGSPWPAISRLVWMPSWTILFVWIYNRTRGSILAPVLFHASMNTMNPLMGVLPATDAGTVLLAVSAGVVVMSDRMWRRLPAEDPAAWGARGLGLRSSQPGRDRSPGAPDGQK